jgi:hypothetical protein
MTELESTIIQDIKNLTDYVGKGTEAFLAKLQEDEKARRKPFRVSAWEWLKRTLRRRLI